jgi:Zn-dependent protease
MTAPRRTHGTPLGAGLPLGCWAGVRVSAHWSVLVFVALLTDLLAAGVLPDAAPGRAGAAYLGVALAVAALFVAGLLGHELAHALVARRYGMHVERITLWMLGGVTDLGAEPPSPRADAAIAAAGPLTSLVLGAGFAGLAWLAGGGLVGSALAWLAAVQILLGVFNLMPGAPLDGGRLLRALLWRHYRDRARAADAAARVGRALGVGLVVLGLIEVLAGALGGLWLALIGWFVLSAAGAERYAAHAEPLGNLLVRDVMTPRPTVAAGWWTVADFVSQLDQGQVREAAFPVVDIEGHPDGVLTAADLSRVPPKQRTTLRVRDVCHRQPLEVTEDTPLADLVGPIQLHRGVAVVVADGQVRGVVTAAELARAVTAVRLGWHRESERSKQ